MAENVLDTLKARGFVKQITFEEDLYRLLGSGVRQSNEYGPGDAGFHRKAGYGVGHLYVPLHRGRASGAEEGSHHAV